MYILDNKGIDVVFPVIPKRTEGSSVAQSKIKCKAAEYMLK